MRETARERDSERDIERDSEGEKPDEKVVTQEMRKQRAIFAILFFFPDQDNTSQIPRPR